MIGQNYYLCVMSQGMITLRAHAVLEYQQQAIMYRCVYSVNGQHRHFAYFNLNGE